MNAFSVDLLTPSAVLVKEAKAESITVTTTRGEITILPGHTHIIEQLDTGMLTLVQGDKKTYYSVTTGICKVLKDRVVFLSTVSEPLDDIDLSRAEKALKVAREKLQGNESLSEDEFLKYNRKLARAEVRIKMALSRG